MWNDDKKCVEYFDLHEGKPAADKRVVQHTAQSQDTKNY